MPITGSKPGKINRNEDLKTNNTLYSCRPGAHELFAKIYSQAFWRSIQAAIFVHLNPTIMKKVIFASLILLAIGARAQDKEKVPAAKGVVYGAVSDKEKAIAAEEIKNKLVNDQFEGQIKAKVVEVCKAEGCWIKVERKDGSPMMVRAKNHAFLMPENIVGKTVLIEGNATIKEISEDMRKHYAEDAGKSKEEIAKIKGSEKDVQFAAKGVKVLD